MTHIKDYQFLFYGSGSGVGCSCLIASIQHYYNTLAVEEESLPQKILYLDCDASQSLKAHELYRACPANWQEFCEYLKQGIASEEFGWIAIDHLHGAYEWAFAYMCKKTGVAHPGDRNDMGKTWTLFTQEFMRPIKELAASGKGFVATSHSTNSQIFERGRTYNLWVPSFVGGSARSTYAQIISLFPIIGFIHPEGIEAPPTKATDTKTVDVRAQAGTEIQLEAGKGGVYLERRVVEFLKAVHWEAKDRSRRFTRIVLPDDYRDDWKTLVEAWERGRD